MKANIGITIEKKEWVKKLTRYIEVVKKAGANPILLFEDTKNLNQIDGLLVSGGFPLKKLIATKVLLSLKDLNPEKYKFESKLIKIALSRNIPILGICRGHQMLNEAAGGSTDYRNLKFITNIKHFSRPLNGPAHKILIKPNTRLRSIIGKSELKVQSSHRQAIKKVAPNFIISALAEDNIIEAIENKKHFAIGVQFHPDRMYKKYPIFMKIFKEFIKEAIRYKKRKLKNLT